MRDDFNISALQFIVLVVFFILGSAILFVPAILTGVAKQDAVFANILGSILGYIVVFFYSKFALVFPEQSFIEVIKTTFGKWIGSGFVSIIFIVYIFLCSVLLWDIGDFMVAQILPGTPIQAIYVMFLIVVVYVTRLGIETIARTAEVFMPWIIILFTLLIVLLLPQIEWKNQLPLFENGVKPIIYGSYYLVGFPYLELIIMLMFTQYLKDKKKLTKNFILGAIIGSITLIILTLFCVLVLGPGITARNEYPIYDLGKKISIAKFLERLEIFVAIIWFLSIFFKLTLTFYGLCLGLTQFLNIRDYKVITTPLAAFLFVSTLILIPNSIFLKNYTTYSSTPFLIFAGLLLPLIVYIFARRKKNTTQNKTMKEQEKS